MEARKGMSKLQVCDGDKPFYGLTASNVRKYRAFMMAYGMHHDKAMVYLEGIYKANKAMSTIPH